MPNAPVASLASDTLSDVPPYLRDRILADKARQADTSATVPYAPRPAGAAAAPAPAPTRATRPTPRAVEVPPIELQLRDVDVPTTADVAPSAGAPSIEVAKEEDLPTATVLAEGAVEWTLAERLRRARQAVGWSQAQLAARLGWGLKTTVSNIESLNTKHLTEARAADLARVLGGDWTSYVDTSPAIEQRRTVLTRGRATAAANRRAAATAACTPVAPVDAGAASATAPIADAPVDVELPAPAPLLTLRDTPRTGSFVDPDRLSAPVSGSVVPATSGEVPDPAALGIAAPASRPTLTRAHVSAIARFLPPRDLVAFAQRFPDLVQIDADVARAHEVLAWLDAVVPEGAAA